MNEEVKARVLALREDAVENQHYLETLTLEKNSTLEWRRKQLLGLSDDVLRAVISLCQTVYNASYSIAISALKGSCTEDGLKAFAAVDIMRVENKYDNVRVVGKAGECIHGLSSG